MLSRIMTLGTLALLVPVLGCEEKAPPAPEPQEVFVVEAEEQPYNPERGFNAHIQSKTDVNISAEVSGKLLAIHFREGDEVTAGTPLFDIDPAPYKAALSQAKAELTKAKANLANAKKNFSRAKKLVDDGYISGSEYDELESRELEAAAAVEAAKAALESAQVNLEYTTIKAPQDGRVGRAIPSVGDVVGPSSGPLTTLVGKEGMQVVFQVPERVVITSQRPDSRIKPEDIQVAIIMPDGSEYPHTGKIDYISNRVDHTTGTVEVRADLPNHNELLRPGMYVQAVVRVTDAFQSLMIPQAAVQVDQQGTYVLAVDDSDTVTRINLTTGDRVGENVLVNSGLKAGTRIIMRGIQKVRPGSEVKVSEYKPSTEPSGSEQP